MFSASKRIPNILWTSKVHYHVRKKDHLYLSWVRWIQFSPSFFFKTHFNIVIPSMPISSVRDISFSFPRQNSVRVSRLTIFVTGSPDHHFVLYMIVLIVFGEEEKLWSSYHTILSISLLRSLLEGKMPSSEPYSRTPSTTVTQNFCDYFQVHSNKRLIFLSQHLLLLFFPLRHK
jgi:hypothetical protein